MCKMGIQTTLFVALFATEVIFDIFGQGLPGAAQVPSNGGDDVAKPSAFDIIIDKIEFQGSKYIDMSKVEYLKKSKTKWTVEGMIQVLEDIPPEMKVTGFASRKLGTQYVKQAVAIDSMDPCTGFESDKILAPEIKAATNITDLCPLKQGAYYVKDYMPNPDRFPPNLPEGEYKVELSLVNPDTKEIAVFLTCYFHTVAKSL